MKKLEIKITFELHDHISINSVLRNIRYFAWSALVRSVGAVIEKRIYESCPAGLVEIRNNVAKNSGIEPDELNEDTREIRIREPRQIAMYLSRKMIKPTPSFREVGNYYGGKDHATVIHAVKTITNYIETDANFRQRIEKIESELL